MTEQNNSNTVIKSENINMYNHSNFHQYEKIHLHCVRLGL